MIYVGILFISLHITTLFANQIEFSVKENTKIGTVVGNIYTKLSPHENKTKLELIKNDYNGESYISLNKDTGDLLVRSIIDREAICEDRKEDDCTISLIIDRDKDVLQVKVTIEDDNDNSPSFISAQNIINIQENIPLGTMYFLPVAQDKDTTKFGVNNYSISNFRAIDYKMRDKSLSVDNYFKIEGSLSPQLKVIGKIDREETVSFVFLFIASDYVQKTGSCTVTVIVTDVNDNSPEWKKDNYKVKIKECQSHGEILEFDAHDKDDPNTSNGRVTYRFSDRTKNREKVSQIFYINSNKLYLSNTRPSELSYTGLVTIFVIASDGNGRMKETSVDVMIEDCNDHPPIISISKRYGNIVENQNERHSLSIVNVKDDDRGRNGVFECWLNDTSVLALVKKHVDTTQNTVIYKIETNGEYSFDREAAAVYTVEIKCVDKGDPVLSSTQRFSINIIDQNDNAPKFEDKLQVFHIAENNAIGSTVGHVKAIDPDYGMNGHIRYNIVGNNDYFTIGIYGDIQTKVKFDREERDSYEFEILASDNGNPTLNDTMAIKVVLMDINDCTPIFIEEYIFKVVESSGETLKNERLGDVKAIDKDYGYNGTVNYRLVNMKPGGEKGLAVLKPQLQRLIRVGSDGGISIYGNLDREKISTIQLTVEAFDNGNPSLSSQTTVVIEIIDLNDNAPTFTFPNLSKKYLNISLDSDIGTTVGTVSATDPDQGVNGTLTYSFVGSVKQDFDPMRLEADGRIVVISDLRKFSKTRRRPDNFLVRATDLGTPPKSTISTLFLHYYEPNNDVNQPLSVKKSTETTINNSLSKYKKNKLHNENNHSNSVISDSMMLLYCLAAILFFIFIIVFSVLLYIYCSKAYTSSERYSKKLYKTNNSARSSNTNMKEFQQMSMNAAESYSGNNDNAATVCFVNDDGTSYTHLMMLNNNKYTPMLHTNLSPNAYPRRGDILSVSQNFLNSSNNDTHSQFISTSPQMSKASMKKFSFPNINNNNDDNHTPLVNCVGNYSTLQDKLSFDSLNRITKARTLSAVDKHYSVDGSDFGEPQKNFGSPYVTSSFV